MDGRVLCRHSSYSMGNIFYRFEQIRKVCNPFLPNPVLFGGRGTSRRNSCCQQPKPKRRLRSITTILLLTSFLALQYAWQVGYWECRLSNYFKAENQKCDCQNLIKQAAAGQDESSPMSAVHNHFHVDDSFYPPCIISTEGIYNTKIFFGSSPGYTFIERIIPGRLDRPPQKG
jgi:hypothetical protein